MPTSILSASDLVKTFGAGHTQVRAVDGVSLELASGELVTITGPSGSGKTTLVSILGALLRADSGRVEIGGQDIMAMNEAELSRLRARTIGFVFQSFNLLEALSVRENVLFPARLAPGGSRAAAARADALLKRLGLERRKDALPATLSGGEKQRTAIARALINQPKLIIADEPTGNLDSHSGQEVMMVLHDVARDQGCAVLIVTHDQRIEDVADRVLWLEDGALRDPKAEPRRLLRDPVCNMLVDGELTTFSAVHDGRRFHFCSRRCQERFLAEPGAFLAPGDPAGTGERMPR